MHTNLGLIVMGNDLIARLTRIFVNVMLPAQMMATVTIRSVASRLFRRLNVPRIVRMACVLRLVMRVQPAMRSVVTKLELCVHAVQMGTPFATRQLSQRN